MIASIKGEVHLEGSASEIMTDACLILTALHNKGMLKPAFDVFITLLKQEHPIFDVEPVIDKAWEAYEE